MFDSLSELPSDDVIAAAYVRDVPTKVGVDGDEPWSVDALRLLVYYDAIRAWRVIRRIVAGVPHEVLPVVGTGPLEEFIHRYGDKYLTEIESAAEDNRFVVALSNVWLSKGRFQPEVEARLVRASRGTITLLNNVESAES